MSPPADAEQPGARRCDAGWFARTERLEPVAPTVEPLARRGCVEADRRRGAGPLCPVLPRVEQHIAQRIAHLARRAQRADVVAAQYNRAAASEDPMDSARKARADRFHRRPERTF